MKKWKRMTVVLVVSAFMMSGVWAYFSATGKTGVNVQTAQQTLSVTPEKLVVPNDGYFLPGEEIPLSYTICMTGDRAMDLKSEIVLQFQDSVSYEKLAEKLSIGIKEAGEMYAPRKELDNLPGKSLIFKEKDAVGRKIVYEIDHGVFSGVHETTPEVGWKKSGVPEEIGFYLIFDQDIANDAQKILCDVNATVYAKQHAGTNEGDWLALKNLYAE